MYDGPVIDIHAHVRFGDDDKVNDAHGKGPTALVDAVRIDNVRHATAIVIARRDDPATGGTNDAVLATAAGTDGFLIPVVSVHPHDGAAALAELERVAAAGARMLKLHPNTQQFDVADDLVTAVVRRAGALGMLVLFDGWSPFDADQPGKFIRLAMACPETRLVLAHLNGPGFTDLLVYETVARYSWWPGNVYHDLSVVAEMFAGGPYAEHLTWVVRRIGTDRMLYGSDWPLCDPATALGALRSLAFTDDEERQILHDNAAALLGLGSA
jgi:uncharacterized protein